MKRTSVFLLTISLLTGCATHSPSTASAKTSPNGTVIDLPADNQPDFSSQRNNAQTNVGKMLSH